MNRRFLILVTALLAGVASAYTVQKGDTLFSIASANGITVDELKRLNGLGSNNVSLGQILRLSGQPDTAEGAAGSSGSVAASKPTPTKTGSTSTSLTSPSTTNTGLPPAQLPPPLSPERLAPTANSKLAGLEISVPSKVTMGDAFIMRLSGPKAGEAAVSFPSEVGEDVRRPNELLKPVGAAGEYRVLGRAVLGKTTPVVYEVKLGGQTVRGKIPVGDLEQTVQHLNLPPKVSGLLRDAGRRAEENTVENAYALRTPPQWSKPFAAALSSRASSSSFGQPRTYTVGGPVNYHYGVDYPAAVGTPVTAVNDGTVVIAGRFPVRGNLVAIDHGGGLISLYFHQSKLLVKVGDKVVRGQKIGLVGTTGLSAGPHLHLEMRVRGEGTNPQGWTGRIWPR